jgi:hypothetical protein
MQILTKRNLLLGNVLLGLVFALVAYSAVRPLLRPGVVVETAAKGPAATPVGETFEAEKEHHLAMRDEYASVIIGDNIFLAKVPPPPPEKPKPEQIPALVKPQWELAGTWEPEPGVWEATLRDKRKKEELVAREGTRFPEYSIVITEVTPDYVRYEIREEKYNRITELFVPEEAGRGAEKMKDWSAIITQLRQNNYAVDMNPFEAECQAIAGEGGDWVEALINTVKAEPVVGADGSFQGYKVLSFTPRSPVDDLGIERQDIITGLVRKPISSESQAREMLREALASDEVQLSVSRLGKPVYIVIQLKRF